MAASRRGQPSRQRTISSPLQNPMLARESRPAFPHSESAASGWSQGHIRSTSQASANAALASMLARAPSGSSQTGRRSRPPVPALPADSDLENLRASAYSTPTASPPRLARARKAEPNVHVESRFPEVPTRQQVAPWSAPATFPQPRKRGFWRSGKSKSRAAARASIVPTPRPLPLALPRLDSVYRLSASNLLHEVEKGVAREELDKQLTANDDVEELRSPASTADHQPRRHVLSAQVRTDLTHLLSESRAAMNSANEPAASARRGGFRSVFGGTRDETAPIIKTKTHKQPKQPPNRLRKPKPAPKVSKATPIRRIPSPPPLPLSVPSPLPPLFAQEPPADADLRVSGQPLLDYDWLARSSMLFPSMPLSSQETSVHDRVRRRRSSVPIRLPSTSFVATPTRPKPEPVRAGVPSRRELIRAGSLNRSTTEHPMLSTPTVSISRFEADRKLHSARAEKPGNGVRVAGWLQQVTPPDSPPPVAVYIRPASMLSEQEELDRPLYSQSMLSRANSDASVMDPGMHSLSSTPTPHSPMYTPSTPISYSPTLAPSPSHASYISQRTFGSPPRGLRPPGTAPALEKRLSGSRSPTPTPTSPIQPASRGPSPQPPPQPAGPRPYMHDQLASWAPPPTWPSTQRPRQNTSGSTGSLTHASSESGDSELASYESHGSQHRPPVAIVDPTDAARGVRSEVVEQQPTLVYKPLVAAWATGGARPRALTLARSDSLRTAATASVYSTTTMTESDVGRTPLAKTVTEVERAREARERSAAATRRTFKPMASGRPEHFW